MFQHLSETSSCTARRALTFSKVSIVSRHQPPIVRYVDVVIARAPSTRILRRRGRRPESRRCRSDTGSVTHGKQALAAHRPTLVLAASVIPRSQRRIIHSRRYLTAPQRRAHPRTHTHSTRISRRAPNSNSAAAHPFRNALSSQASDVRASSARRAPKRPDTVVGRIGATRRRDPGGSAIHLGGYHNGPSHPDTHARTYTGAQRDSPGGRRGPGRPQPGQPGRSSTHAGRRSRCERTATDLTARPTRRERRAPYLHGACCKH